MGVTEYEVNRIVAEAKWDIDDALMLAVQKNSTPDVIKALIENAGADVSKRGICGWTVLMWAAYRSSYPEVIQILLDAGANLQDCDENGKTVLSWAKENKNTEILRVISAMLGAADESADQNNCSSNSFGLDQKSLNEALLREAGADIPVVESIRNLLKLGAKPDCKDDSGRTALDYAENNRVLQDLKEVVRLLKSHK
jgi:ankyrin repeat protein